MSKKKLSKGQREALASDPDSLLALNEFDQLDQKDFYSDIMKDDPQAVKNAYKSAKKFKNHSVPGGVYDQVIDAYKEKINNTKYLRPINKASSENATSSSLSKNEERENENLKLVTHLTIPELLEIYHNKIVYIHNDDPDFKFYEQCKQIDLYSNIQRYFTQILDNPYTESIDILHKLGWDTLKKNDGCEDFVVFPLEDSKGIFRCYHLTYYGLSLAKISSFESAEDPDEINNQRGLILTHSDKKKNESSSINIYSPFDILIFIIDQNIQHLCYIPNHIFLNVDV